MGQVLKDFAAGAFLAAIAFLAGVALLVLFVVLAFVFHVFAALVSVLFLAALLCFAVWLLGFAYRKAKEIKKK